MQAIRLFLLSATKKILLLARQKYLLPGLVKLEWGNVLISSLMAILILSMAF